ncbi:MAG: hypothetical protein AAGK37_00805 [Pseudomonadota bacterium]
MKARATFLLGLLATPALAEAPLSAIDWLSDSVAAPGDASPAPLPSTTGDAATVAITVTSLDNPDGEAAGLLTSEETGLPKDLWGLATADDAARRIESVPRDLSPALTDLLTVVLLAETDGPGGGGDGDVLFLARVDRLLEMGALDHALELLELAGIDTPDRFRRYFDVALLKGREQAACDVLRLSPGIAPTYPARVFCLARAGDWNAAAVTLETANTLGILSPEEDLLLARFLDPDILDDPDVALETPTPLTFRLREAIGEPLPTTALPLAFAWADLRDTRGWKAQIEAAERLARSGALSADGLFDLYLRQRPSASGGVWARAAAAQALDAAIRTGDAAVVADVLAEAWDAFAPAGLEYTLARQYGSALAGLALDGRAAQIALTLGLLSPEQIGLPFATRSDDPRTRFLLAVARDVPETAVAPDSLSAAVREGLLSETVPAALSQALQERRSGEAILRAITLFSEGASGDLDGVAQAIATLRALGLEEQAQRAAIELLLQDGIG